MKNVSFYSFQNKKKWRMAWGKQQLKFERKPCIMYRDHYERAVGRTNFDFISSPDTVKQS